ncbi:Aldo-keto reductase [Caballeronia sordidicola]|uniref:Aldo-keto reductase n=1 Tax=Caballeronia sordidicola TaxID=196367 RepID=A0A242N3S6_CABSO|nr:Aldo-keto reductase [Caballeronia sordidicola]
MSVGNTIRAALDGTFSLSVPVGLSRKPFRTSSAASISLKSGDSFSMRRSPASVGATLRVVRFSRRSPSLASRRRTAMLRLDADTPLMRAASRKPPARATDTNAARSLNSMGHCSK